MKRNARCAHSAAGCRKRTHFIPAFFILLSFILLFCGCTPNPTIYDPVTAPSATESGQDTASQDPLTLLQRWLEKDFSFTMSYQYMNLAINGTSQETTQTFAADGGWYFKNHRKVWDHTTDYEAEEDAEFYYCYEDGQLICYSSINKGAPRRGVLSSQERKEMDASKAYLIGAPGLLPDYLQDFSMVQTQDAAVFTYYLPIEQILSDKTLLSSYVHNVFSLSGYEYQQEAKLLIGCTFEADPTTFQPKSLSFDFSQIKPFVLTSGALSGEYALKTDFMTMVYTFDYDLPPTIGLPENLVP